MSLSILQTLLFVGIRNEMAIGALPFHALKKSRIDNRAWRCPSETPRCHGVAVSCRHRSSVFEITVWTSEAKKSWWPLKPTESNASRRLLQLGQHDPSVATR